MTETIEYIRILEEYIIDENISEIDNIFNGFQSRQYDLENYVLYRCIIHSNPTLFRYYRNKGFTISGYGFHEKYTKIYFHLENAIKLKTLKITMIEEIRKDIDEYKFKNMILSYLEYSLEVKNIEFARKLYFQYKEICDSDYIDIVLVYLIQLKINDIFLEYVKLTSDMKNVRIWADAYQNTFVLKWLYDTGRIVEIGVDPYKRIPSYERVGTPYKFMLAKYNLEFNGAKVSQTIYKDYMNLLMKVIG
jgi:hypothetical protein